MHERISPRKRIGLARRVAGVGAALTLAGCLDRHGGRGDPAADEPSTGDGSSSGGWATGTGIMTTTIDPSPGGSDGGGAGEAPAPCGNGKIDPHEQCDEGEANADDAKCTSSCRWNVCGDGMVEAGDEVCDDGKAKNGSYGHCDQYCDKLAERCGDGVVQTEEGEECDDPEPMYGCLPDCTQAASCLAIKAGWGDAAHTGLHLLWRGGTALTVWCDMEADGGGYTFFKYASGTVVSNPPDPDEFLAQDLTAAQAEEKCAHWGLRLFSPRSAAHLRAALVAASADIYAPISDEGSYLPTLDVDSDVAGYLAIMGIYPVTPGVSCESKPLNSEDCPQWAARPDPQSPDEPMPYWVSDKLFLGQPGSNNCAGCSLLYDWNLDVQPPVLAGYYAVAMNGKGATSPYFLCELGDKRGPPED